MSLLKRVCRPSGCRSFSSTKWDYDVVINGGGVVGAAFAADLLARTKGRCKIAIIEPQKVKELKTSKTLPEIRVYALAARSIDFLKQIGAWEFVVERSHPYTTMQISESSGPGLVKFRADKMGVEELGRTCEDSTIQSAIFCAIQKSGYSFDLIQSESIIDISSPDSKSLGCDPVKITLSSNLKSDTPPQTTVLSSRLLVGADGAQSIVRRISGIPTWGWSYGVEGIVATVSIRDTLPTEVTDEVINNTAWQNYLPTGPLALLPLWNGYASIVWSVPAPHAKRLKSLSDADFLQELNNALRTTPKYDECSTHRADDNKDFSVQKLLGEFRREIQGVANAAMSAAQLTDPHVLPPEVKHICSPRVSFPLSFQQSRKYVQPRIALIGDAAHSIHPQAGQGLNLGLADAACLSRTVDEALSSGQDFGTLGVLDKFAKERYTKNLLMMSTVDTINSMFKNDFVAFGCQSESDSPLLKGKQLVRSLGMLGVHSLGPLKHEMAKYAMGLK